MKKLLISFALLSASLSTQAGVAHAASLAETAQKPEDSPAHTLNPVIQWNRTLLVIVRTPGAQSPTVHPTRNFAIMHAAIYDAVNAIDERHKPYLVTLPEVPRNASQEAAAAGSTRGINQALYDLQSAAGCRASEVVSLDCRRKGKDPRYCDRIGRCGSHFGSAKQ
jgi:hypothetical protein